jgi:hypothetical protein
MMRKPGELHPHRVMCAARRLRVTRSTTLSR